ncbi:helix-turn-helix domain-containing protein [Corynebacterium glutamicum]|uniref:helix-turn-helix domain-containing protein n=1 Tax=Corynebacterium glutamicum TaxID=1718 RepID=UPI0009422FD0|nr:helix-turn-helix transcriptional regulator [Corynebacterium glutamicum]OKX79839.1 hypothetical protein AUO95_11600 [Corynebacterium glutamicum]
MGFIENEQRFIRRMIENRNRKGWSQNEFARRLGAVGINWKQPTVARVEEGSRPLRFGEAMAIAQFFNETIESMSAPETMTAWNVRVRLASEAMLAETLHHRHLETAQMQSEILSFYEGEPPYQRLPRAARVWLDWLEQAPGAQAEFAIHDDINLYEAAIAESRRITVRSIHEVDRPNASS